MIMRRLLLVVSFLTFASGTAIAQSDSTAADTVIVIKTGDSSQLVIMLAVLALLILMLFIVKSAFKRGPGPM